MEHLIFYLQSALLGVVEGITEFLPVSSTGHLIVFEDLLGFQGSASYTNAFSYIIQLGAILAVIVLYWNKIVSTLRRFFPKKEGGTWVRTYRQSGLRFWIMLAVACIPGFLTVMVLGDLVDTYLFHAASVAVVLIAGGIAILLAERYGKKSPHHPYRKGQWLFVTVRQALLIGTFQCLSVIPGMSRSASTIIGGWFAGLSTAASAEFSFFLAIPVMLGMSFLSLIQIGGIASMSAAELVGLAIGLAVSFGVALMVVKTFVSYLQKHSMVPFAFYRIAFGVILLLLSFSGVIHFPQA